MSYQSRSIETRSLVCDLCGEIIPDGIPAERGSLTRGYIAYDVTAKTKHAWLIWPRKKIGGPRVEERHYDFHAECIGRLVESAVGSR